MSASAGVALGYEPLADDKRRDLRLWIPAGGSHVVPAVSAAFKSALLSAVLELKPRNDVRVVVLGSEIDALGSNERAALRAQVAFLPSNGGLISHLNCWENIVLPIGYHAPQQVLGLAPEATALLEQFCADARSLLAKLPEEMTLYERKLAGYVRMRLGRPKLALAEDLGGGLGGGERRQAESFAAAYLADTPEGTFVQLKDLPDESG